MTNENILRCTQKRHIILFISYKNKKEIPIHETQLVNYLTATHTDHGLLINFGGERIEIKRKFREYKHI